MLERLLLWLSDDEVPKSGHEYYDLATGERIQITSVKKGVIELKPARQDKETYAADRETFLKAYRLGFITHADDCYHCKNRR